MEETSPQPVAPMTMDHEGETPTKTVAVAEVHEPAEKPLTSQHPVPHKSKCASKTFPSRKEGGNLPLIFH